MIKRHFLQISWLIVLVVLVCFGSVGTKAKIAQQPITPSDLIKIKSNLVDLINENRRSLGLNPVKLDELASKVGESHCQEMLLENYFSHWNKTGLKPYMRYSQAGGRDALSENLSFSQGGGYYDSVERLTNVLMEMHSRMFNEKPPNDGHRQTIIYPQNTHVGIGIAFDENQVKLAEEFIGRYVEIKDIAKTSKPGGKVDFIGNILSPKDYELAGISMFFETLPQFLGREELNTKGSYSFPSSETILKPMVYGDLVYKDGTKGEVDYKKSSGKFFCQITFPKDVLGVYTLVVWLKKEKEKFPATNISITVE